MVYIIVHQIQPSALVSSDCNYGATEPSKKIHLSEESAVWTAIGSDWLALLNLHIHVFLTSWNKTAPKILTSIGAFRVYSILDKLLHNFFGVTVFMCILRKNMGRHLLPKAFTLWGIYIGMYHPMIYIYIFRGIWFFGKRATDSYRSVTVYLKRILTGHLTPTVT